MIKSVTIFYPDGDLFVYIVGEVSDGGTVTNIEKVHNGCNIVYAEDDMIIEFRNIAMKFVSSVAE